MDIKTRIFLKNWAYALLSTVILFTLFLSGCHGVKKPGNRTPGQICKTGFSAVNIFPKHCRLCESGKGTLLPLYWGQENIGIISLNTFSLAYIGLNRYDDDGNLIETPSGSSSINYVSTGENRFSFSVTENHDRGYANGHLYFRQDEFLDMEKASSLLCTDCLSRVTSSDWGGDPFGLGIIDFKTKEIRLLRENLIAFQFGDYYISCDSERGLEDGNSLEMDMLIFYCPNRYE